MEAKSEGGKYSHSGGRDNSWRIRIYVELQATPVYNQLSQVVTPMEVVVVRPGPIRVVLRHIIDQTVTDVSNKADILAGRRIQQVKTRYVDAPEVWVKRPKKGTRSTVLECAYPGCTWGGYNGKIAVEVLSEATELERNRNQRTPALIVGGIGLALVLVAFFGPFGQVPSFFTGMVGFCLVAAALMGYWAAVSKPPISLDPTRTGHQIIIPRN